MTYQVDLQDLREIDDVNLFRLILDNLFSGVIFCDKECRIIFVNRVYADLLGIEPNEALGKSIFEFFPNSRLPGVMRKAEAELGQRCLLSGKVPYIVNRIPVKKNGRIVGVILESIFKDFSNLKNLISRLDLLESKVKFYRNGLRNLLSARYTFDDIKGESESIRLARKVAAKYAATDSPVLILGATGTGKELFAHSIHMASKRIEGPFVCVNCAAIPKELLESEIFGYAPGAFTGANYKGKIGKMELAHGGSLFLDEIGDLPLDAQAKFLRSLESKVIEKVGSLEPVEVDFRLIAATTRDLKGMIKHGEFRDELFYRLNAMTVYVPKVSERKGDIPALVHYFLNALGKPEIHCTKGAMEVLQRYPWPGNIRELKNVIEQTVSLLDGRVIDVKDLPPEIISLHYNIQVPADQSESLLSRILAQSESHTIRESLKMSKGNMSKTARLLGISRTTLYHKCKKHNLLEYKWIDNGNC